MALSIAATSGEMGVVLAIFLAFFGLAWCMMNKSFRRVISHSHETQEKIDRLQESLSALQSMRVEVVTAAHDRPTRPRSVAPARVAPPGQDGAMRREPPSRQEPDLAHLASSPGQGGSQSGRHSGEWRVCGLSLEQRLESEHLVPVSGQDGKVILDYGCGEGEALAAFAEGGQPRHLVGVDVEASALESARKHLGKCDASSLELNLLPRSGVPIPVEDHVFDYIHCTGALQQAVPLHDLLGEFARVLKQDGLVRIGLLNSDSVWWHMCAAPRPTAGPVTGTGSQAAGGECKTSVEGTPAAIAVESPTAIPRAYSSREVLTLAAAAGFRARKLGCHVSLAEMSLLGRRFEALACPTLADEHKEFLRTLRFDDRGRPLHDGEVAGFEAVYELALI